MKFSEWERIAAATVAAIQEKLPPEIRELAAGVPVLVQAAPDSCVLANGFESDLLGLFTGTPYGSEVLLSQPEPPTIILYLRNLWDYADGDTATFRAEVRLTYLHELGHYRGWNEDQLSDRGLD